MKKLTIVKIGGRIIDDQNKLRASLQKFAQIKGAKILVHGGGKTASDILAEMGIESKMTGGRRITDKKTLDVVQMVYAGLLNKNIVALLQSMNCNCLGMSGADAGSILAHKRVVDKIDYGFAGDVDEVNGDTIEQILGCDLVPVFCALTHDGKGQMLNTNADTITTELAIALSSAYQVSIIYTFEKNGVLENIEDSDSVIRHINPLLYAELKKNGKVQDGMIPKLDNIFHALNGGVKEVYIKNWLSGNAGTKVTLE